MRGMVWVIFLLVCLLGDARRIVNDDFATPSWEPNSLAEDLHDYAHGPPAHFQDDSAYWRSLQGLLCGHMAAGLGLVALQWLFIWTPDSNYIKKAIRAPVNCSARAFDTFFAYAFFALAVFVFLNEWRARAIIEASSDLSHITGKLANHLRTLNIDAKALVGGARVASEGAVAVAEACQGSFEPAVAELQSQATAFTAATANIRDMLGGTARALENLSTVADTAAPRIIYAGNWSLGILAGLAIVLGLRATALSEALTLSQLRSERTKTCCPSPASMGCGGCWGWLGRGARGKRFVLICGSAVLVLLVAEVSFALTTSVAVADLCTTGAEHGSEVRVYPLHAPC